MTSYKNIAAAGGRAHIALSEFRPSASADAGYNAIISPAAPGGKPFAEQWGAVADALGELCAGSARPLFVRVFLSDPVNQAPLLAGLPDCALSVVGQAPMGQGLPKVVVWACLRENVAVTPLSGGMYEVSIGDGSLCEYWQGGSAIPGSSTYRASVDMLGEYADVLRSRGMTLADNCMRTWFFVRDVDTAYAGMVRGRNELFEREGLLPSTHFIASTGIGAAAADVSVGVMLDTYAVAGLAPDAVRYLKAAENMNPTSEYGVAFERATEIAFPDGRRHVLVSGTASIDSRGEIVYPGDIVRQTERMCLNVEALLDEAACTPADMTHAIVYIRDTADAATVGRIIADRYPGLPFALVLGPVCRPGWLVEMECMAAR